MTRANRAALFVLSGTTGYGIALFSYLVNRSADHIVPYVSLPAVMVVVLWLSILLRDRRLSQVGRALLVGSATAIAALLVAVAWSNAGLRFSQSALAYLPPGGKSFRAAIDRLSDGPQLASGVGGCDAHARHVHARRARVSRAHLGGPLRRGADADPQGQPDPAQRPVGGQSRPESARKGGRVGRRSASTGEAHADRSCIDGRCSSRAPIRARRSPCSRASRSVGSPSASGSSGWRSLRVGWRWSSSVRAESAPVLARGHDVPAVQEHPHAGPDRLQAVDDAGLEAH